MSIETCSRKKCNNSRISPSKTKSGKPSVNCEYHYNLQQAREANRGKRKRDWKKAYGVVIKII